MKQSIDTIALVLLLIFSCCCTKIYAGHVFATELTYKCLGNNQYLVIATLYKECSSDPPPSNLTITINSYSCQSSLPDMDLPLIPALSGMVVTPICSNFANNTTCNGGAIPAEDIAIYQDTITLPTACPDWILGLSHAVRSSYYTNLVNPGNDNIYVEALLDNSFGACNDAPVLKNHTMLYSCAGQTFEYDLSAQQAEADSLRYTLLTPKINNVQNASFQPGLSVSNPLALQAGAFVLNHQTGQLTFTPQAGLNQIACISIQIEKWQAGKLIASTIAELNINVSISCNNQPVLLTNTQVNTPGWTYDEMSNTFVNCGGTMDSIAFTSTFYNADGNALLLEVDSALWDNQLGASNWSIDLMNTPPLSSDSGTLAIQLLNPTYNSSLPISMTDNSCPYTSIRNTYYNFRPAFVHASASASVVCSNTNNTVSLNAEGSHFIQSIVWAQIPNGAPNTNISDPSVVNPTVDINMLDTAMALMYEVTADLGNCIAVDTITIQVVKNPSISFTITDASTNSATDGSINTIVNGNLAQFSYAWQNGMTTNQIQNLSANDYVLTVTDFYGCSTSDTATVSVHSSLDALPVHHALKIYPNPTKEILYIELDYSSTIAILLYNNLGQVVLEKTAINIQQNHPYTLSLPQNVSGVYWLKISENNKSYGQKIIVD